MSMDLQRDAIEQYLGKLTRAVAQGKREDAVELTRELTEMGADAAEVLHAGLIPGINEVGERFRECQCFVPEVLIATRAMRVCVQLLRPFLAQQEIPQRATMILGTVFGDLHDLGKNLVGIMAEGAGVHVIDLGVDVSPQTFVEAARQHRAGIVGISALLTTTMPHVGEVVRAFEASGLREQVKLLVGGAPVTAEWAKEIGADGYARDASSAALWCKRHLENEVL